MDKLIISMAIVSDYQRVVVTCCTIIVFFWLIIILLILQKREWIWRIESIKHLRRVDVLVSGSLITMYPNALYTLHDMDLDNFSCNNVVGTSSFGPTNPLKSLVISG